MAAGSAEKARALEQCERELDLAIERLVNLRLDPEDDAGDDDGDGDAPPDTIINNAAAHHAPAAAAPVPSCGGISNRAEWVERLLGEMASGGDVGDARARAARFLGDFLAAERDVAQRQNGVLKRAVLRQLKEGEAANAELRRQLAGCQERVRSLETDNYALAMYLRRAQPQGGAMPGRFHPEVF